MESMRWEKKGLICDCRTLDLPWFRKNAMVPLVHRIADKRLRIFMTMCDESNVGRIGYVDVAIDDPRRILGYSGHPVLDIGDEGTFSDNGILTSSLLRVDDRLFMYYSGYQACVKVPYLIFSGVAVSIDNGDSFQNLTRAPLLDRVEGEIFTRSGPTVMHENGQFRVWYTSDARKAWITDGGKSRPCYDLKQIVAASPTSWPKGSGSKCLELRGDDEHGISKSTIWKDGGVYKMIYSLRTISAGYRLGYAESGDGVEFVRKDDQVGIGVSSDGWDSQMICFPERFSYGGRTYLFYCGNHYGIGGVGYAELIQ